MPGIYVGTSEVKSIYVGTVPVKEVYVGTTKVRPSTPPCLCFTANTANSTVRLQKVGSPTAVSLEKSTDGSNWSSYTIGSTITLSSVGSKVYFRSTSTTDTTFSTSTSDFYQFVMSGSVAGSGNISYLLNKNGTNTMKDYCFANLFRGCTALTTAPSLPATTIGEFCYFYMFDSCTALTTITNLPATTLKRYCYCGMFYGCSSIKNNYTKVGIYQTPYRIPTSGTGTQAENAIYYMFANTGGAFTGMSINGTIYTSNTIV